MTVTELYNRGRTSRVWTLIVPMLVGASYAWWRYHRFLFWPTVTMIVVVSLIKIICDWWCGRQEKQSWFLDQGADLLTVILPFVLLVGELLLNTGYQLSVSLLSVWFAVALPLMLFALSMVLAKDVRQIRAETVSDDELAQVRSRASLIRPIFLLLPVLAYADILLLTLSAYLPLLSWAMIVIFPLVFAQSLAVGLESDLDKSADLPARNLFLTGLALALVLTIAG